MRIKNAAMACCRAKDTDKEAPQSKCVTKINETYNLRSQRAEANACSDFISPF